jgi:Tol biopolymer transport system component
MREASRLVLLLALAGCSLLFPGTGGAAFPGSNGRIVFVSDRDAGNLGLNGREIYTAGPDGSNPLRLTTNTVADTEPAYSPDGTRIAFTRSGDIWVMNADGGGAVVITGTEGPDSDPAWSPDGSQIVYVSNQTVSGGGTTGPELFVTSAAGPSPQRRLTDTPNGASQAPAWSPTGDQIAYQSNADGGDEIYTIDATATASFGVRRSANEVGQNYQNPSWSPDAARIAFERGTGTNVGDTTKEIWTMRADGSDPVRLTSNSVYDVQPAYSPDCTRIAYEANEDGDREIYTRPAAAGGTSTNVTNTPAGISDEQPDWGSGGSSAPLCASAPGGGGPGGGGGPLTLADLDNPTLGVDVNVQAISGTVRVGIRGTSARASGSGHASQKGITFVPLTEARQIPVGSFLDTRRGTVRLESARDLKGTRQRGNFSRSLFQALQSRKRSARGLTNLVMKGSSFRGCRAGRSKAASAALSRRTIRRLRASARGHFRTTGRNSSATVRGTVWDVNDRCDGTLTRVRRGRVAVRDFRRKRNITVTAGKAYLAKAPG